MKKFLVLAILMVLSLSLVACGGNNNAGNNAANNNNANSDVLRMTLAHASPEDTVTGLLSNHFSEQVYELSNGTMQIEVFPNSQLGGDVEILTNLGHGQIDFIVGNTAPQVGTIPKLALFDIPNVFENEQIARKVFEDNTFMDKIRSEYQGAGYKLLGFSDQSFRELSSNSRVESKADLNGLLIRTLENPYHISYWQALGASPTPMPFSELFVALQQGTVAAQENPIEVIVANSFYEVQDYVIKTNHLLHIISLVTNESSFNNLTPEQQDIITQAAANTIPWSREQADLRLQQRIDVLNDNNVNIVEISPAFRQEIIDSIGGVRDEIRGVVGDDLYNELFAAVDRAN